MFVPTKLEIRNFCLIQSATVKFIGAGMYYIVGEFQNEVGDIISNGAGKSTFLNGLWFSLFGSLMSKTDVRSCIGPFDESCTATVTLTDGKQVIAIQRHRSVSGASVCLFVDGKKQLIGLPATEVNGRISKMLSVDWSMFRLTNYIAQEDNKTGFVYAKDSARKEIVTRLYDLGRLDKILAKARDVLHGQNNELQALRLQESRLEGEYSSALLAVEQMREQQVESIGDKVAIQKSIDRNRASWDKGSSAYKVRRKEVSEEKIVRRALRAKLDEALDVQSTLTSKVNVMDAHYNDLAHEEATKDKCPICLSPFSEESRNAFKKKMADVKNDIIKIRTGELAQAKKRVAELQKLVAASEKKEGVSFASMEAARMRVMRAQKVVPALEEKLKAATRGEDHQAKIKAMMQRAKEIAKSLSKVQQTIAELEGQIKDTKFWADAYSKEIKALVFESVVDELTLTVNGYLMYLAGSQFTAKIVTESKGSKETVGLMMTEHDGAGWRPVELASGGQKKLISLAFALAMQSIRRSSLGIMLLDEATENLDSHASRLAIDAIKRASTDKLVLYVTHDNSTVPAGALTIKATRANGKISLS